MDILYKKKFTELTMDVIIICGQFKGRRGKMIEAFVSDTESRVELDTGERVVIPNKCIKKLEPGHRK